MSSKYNRYLLSSCLPLMALAVCVPNVANAGFEWTPPEKIAPPVEVMPVPDIDSMMPVSPAPVESEVIEGNSLDTNIVEFEEEEPAIEIIVIDDSEEGAIPTIVHVEEDVPEDIEIIVIEDDVAEIVDDTPTAEIEEINIVDDAPLDVGMAVEDHHETMKAPVKGGGSLVLNPYPLESGAVEQESEDIVWNTPESFEVIEGFGSDMPLALALRQIVPAKYAFSFGSGVNPGARISWHGDKPWNEVLSEAVAPIGVKVVVGNKKVLLSADESLKPKKESAAKIVYTEEHAEKEDEAEIIMDAPEGDAAPVEEVAASISEAVEQEVTEDKEIFETQTPAPEDGMNDALREVYGDSVPSSEVSGVLGAQPLLLDSDDDIYDMVEELLEPVNIVEGQDGMIAPDMNELSSESGDANETVIDRGNIIDPGESEGVQPNIFEDSGLLMEQKKN